MKIAQFFAWGFAVALSAVACGGGEEDPAGPAATGIAPPTSSTPSTPSTPPAPGNGLASLTISGATLSPSFTHDVTKYRAAVEVMSKSPFTITPTAEHGAATITVNGVPVVSGQPSKPIRITEAFNPIDITVKTPQGPSTKYVIMAAAAQDAYVKPSNTRIEGRFGQDLALSGDLLAVGSWGDASAATGVDGNQLDASAPRSGAVYVYKRTDGTWKQEAYIKASNTRADAYFGITVALSGDTLAVGAFHEPSAATGVNGDQNDTGAPGAGAAYVFRRTTEIVSDCEVATWTQEAFIKPSNTRPDAEFGTAVSIDGNTLAVGSSGESSSATGVNGDWNDSTAPSAGAAYIFTRTSDSTSLTWSQEAYLKPSNTRAAALFGNSVSVEGDTVAVGSLHESSIATGVNGNQADTSAPGTGAAYVFTRAAGAWSQQAYIKSSNTHASSDVTGGFSIAVSLSGNTLAVGCYVEASSATGTNGNAGDTSALNAGAVYVYSRAGNAWSHQAYLKPPNTRSLALFGYSVALASDTLVVGSINESSRATGIDGNPGDTTMPNAGGAYVFKRVAGLWSHEAYMKASNTRPDSAFGYSVALSGDRIAIGSTMESSGATGVNGNQADTSAPLSGAVYVFR